MHFSSKFETMLFALCLNDSGKASMRTLLEVRKGHFNVETNSIVVYPTAIPLICFAPNQEIKQTGIRPKTDPRFKCLISRIAKFKAKPNATLESVTLTLEQLKEVINGYVPLLTKVFQNELIIPEFGAFCENVKTLYYKCANNFGGEVRNS